MGERGGAYRVSVENLREIDHLEDLSVDGRLILKLDFQELGWSHGMD
jgi:hypothetical protein